LLHFFKADPTLDLMIHKVAKPFVVLTEGVTVENGLDIAAGSDMVIAAGSTLMAMPETLIGFFPDVRTTGWILAHPFDAVQKYSDMIRDIENYTPDRNL